MYTPIHILQGTRYFLESLKQKIQGPTKYKGNAEEICRQIVKNCWNGRYFQASTHHYKEFWTRDFGYCAESLAKLGYLDEIRKTLAYALEKFSKTGIKTTITRGGRPFSFPNVYSPDSSALLVYALRVANDKELVEKYEEFLQQEIEKFEKIVLKNGRVQDAQFSGMRDYAKRKSSCYDHCMAILMAREAKKLGFAFGYTEKELTKTLDEYWAGYYKDDRTTKEPSGDANTLPYWLSVGKNFSDALKTIRKNKLDEPMPLAYSRKPQKMIGAEVFVPNWENNSIWPLQGFLWIQAAKKHSLRLARKYKLTYAKIIEKYGTLYEVYTGDKPYKSLFYHADEGMLWAANYLTL